jgi:hypothetical protein
MLVVLVIKFQVLKKLNFFNYSSHFDIITIMQILSILSILFLATTANACFGRFTECPACGEGSDMCCWCTLGGRVQEMSYRHFCCDNRNLMEKLGFYS